MEQTRIGSTENIKESGRKMFATRYLWSCKLIICVEIHYIRYVYIGMDGYAWIRMDTRDSA